MTALAATLTDEAPIGVGEALLQLDGAAIALFLDIDGTLLDLALRPDAVSVPADLAPTLARAERKLAGALALVSGRTIEETDRLFAPLRLCASGVHGAQVRLRPDGPLETVADAGATPKNLATAIRAAIRHCPRLLVEDKGQSVAVHFRLNPEAAPWVRETLRELIDASPSWGVELLDAHYALEVKPSSVDKGKSIALFMRQAPFQGRLPVFIGDDATDEAGFAEVAARGGRGFSVGRRRPGAIGVFESPQAVRAWLAAFSAS